MTFEDLVIHGDGDTVTFRTRDGAVLGAAHAWTVAPLVDAALADLPAALDGASERGVCDFDVSPGDLAAVAMDEGVALTFRDPNRQILARVVIPSDRVDDLVIALRTAALPKPPTGEWAKRRPVQLAVLRHVHGNLRKNEARSASSETIDLFRRRVVNARRDYCHELPHVPIARDPDRGDVVTMQLDDGGLDLPFWDAMQPARPAETMHPHFIAVSGAMRLSRSRLENTSYLCLPGPAVPFVVPALLDRDGVRAVLATLRIGSHAGYVVSYFSARPQPPPLVNEWGRREYWLRERGVATVMAGVYDEDPPPDFELRRWIEAKKLAWIAPGDASMTLSYDVARCPYLSMPGSRRHQRVQAGALF